MKDIWNAIVSGYLKVIAPVADWLVAKRVRPNTITTVGTLCTCTAGVIFATGHIRTGGWFLGLTALFDVLDGTVALLPWVRVRLVLDGTTPPSVDASAEVVSTGGFTLAAS
jgi:uncharacterized membrane protein